jgi:hypothetical protein
MAPVADLAALRAQTKGLATQTTIPIVAGVEVDPEPPHVARDHHQDDRTDSCQYGGLEEVSACELSVGEEPWGPDEEDNEQRNPARGERESDPGWIASEFVELDEEHE